MISKTQELFNVLDEYVSFWIKVSYGEMIAFTKELIGVEMRGNCISFESGGCSIDIDDFKDFTANGDGFVYINVTDNCSIRILGIQED